MTEEQRRYAALWSVYCLIFAHFDFQLLAVGCLATALYNTPLVQNYIECGYSLRTPVGLLILSSLSWGNSPELAAVGALCAICALLVPLCYEEEYESEEG